MCKLPKPIAPAALAMLLLAAAPAFAQNANPSASTAAAATQSYVTPPPYAAPQSQAVDRSVTTGPSQPPANQSAPAPTPAPVYVNTGNYVLGPEDQITVRIIGQSETDFPARPSTIANDGLVNLPMVGAVQAGGLTVEQLEASLETKYAKYFKQPQVTVDVTDFRSQPVSVAGEVTTPGVIQLRGNRNLMEVIAMAGGARPEAGDTVLITRQLSEGRIPVDDAYVDPTGKYSVARIDIRSVMNGKDPKGNIQIMPHDVITVTRARLVYVLGDVGRPGGYVLSDNESMSVTRALALAGGWNHTASLKGTRILRDDGGTQRTQIALNVSRIMKSRSPDLQLMPDDILYVPNSMGKEASIYALTTGVGFLTGYLIWH